MVVPLDHPPQTILALEHEQYVLVVASDAILPVAPTRVVAGIEFLFAVPLRPDRAEPPPQTEPNHSFSFLWFSCVDGEPNK